MKRASVVLASLLASCAHGRSLRTKPCVLWNQKDEVRHIQNLFRGEGAPIGSKEFDEALKSAAAVQEYLDGCLPEEPPKEEVL